MFAARMLTVADALLRKLPDLPLVEAVTPSRLGLPDLHRIADATTAA